MKSYLPKKKTDLISLLWFNKRKIREIIKKYLYKNKNSWTSIKANKEHYTHILFSYIGSFIGISALAYLSVATDYPLIIAPFGATSVLAFAVPDSPLAQPRNIIGGNMIAALVSLIFVHLFGVQPWVMAIAVATAICLMQLTRTLHPPSGAIALVAVMSHASWNFLLTPVLIGSIILVICTVVFNNLVPGRNYPMKWL